MVEETSSIMTSIERISQRNGGQSQRERELVKDTGRLNTKRENLLKRPAVQVKREKCSKKWLRTVTKRETNSKHNDYERFQKEKEMVKETAQNSRAERKNLKEKNGSVLSRIERDKWQRNRSERSPREEELVLKKRLSTVTKRERIGQRTAQNSRTERENFI